MKEVLLATDFKIVYNGIDYYADSAFSSIFLRYYNSFGKITICTRVEKKKDIRYLTCITPAINKVIIVQNLIDVFTLKFSKTIKKELKNSCCVICRLPSLVSIKVAQLARLENKLVLTEMMGDAWDAYWNHGIVGKIIAPYMFLATKHIVWNAKYATYVTEKFLQKRYPCKNESISASNVKIKEPREENLEKRLKKIENMDYHRISLMTSAAVDVVYKGQEYVIKAIPALLKKGITIDYYLAGGGSQERLLKIAQKYKVEQYVHFLGRLPLEEVFEWLQKIDIYIQPSLQEGLPRAMIEAMSFACPCLGARTAGIPELLEDKYVVKRKSEKSIVEKILLITESQNMKGSAKNNFEKSKKYEEEKLNAKRNIYYDKIKK